MRWLNRPLYTLLLRLATPLLLLRLFLRGRKEAAYTQYIGQRLGFYGDLAALRGAVWLHAVSLGEMRTAALFIRQWRQENPNTPLLLTCSTATGRAEGEKLLDSHTQLVWLPWDMPGAVQRFLAHFAPKQGLLMETEVWPNLTHICATNKIPLLLINARLSEKSLKKALRLPKLALPAYSSLAGVLAQSQSDAKNLQKLGCRVLAISGNIKFDVQIDQVQIAQAQALKSSWGQARIWALASSREGEEALFLQALAEKPLPAHTTPLIVPRHPQRFADIAAMAQQAGWQVCRRADFQTLPALADKTLLLGDSMGEMAFYYGLSDLAFMGGSYLPFGGQNLIEALACYCPVVLGPHTFNFAEASDWAEEAGLAHRVSNMTQALDWAAQSITQKPIDAAAFTSFLQDKQGAITRTLAGIAAYQMPNGTIKI